MLVSLDNPVSLEPDQPNVTDYGKFQMPEPKKKYLAVQLSAKPTTV